MSKEFEDGMVEAVRIIKEIYYMKSDERRILFGEDHPLFVFLREPRNIINYKDILARKDEILRTHVEVGDVFRRGDTEYAVTFVYTEGTFDLITLNTPLKGSVLSHVHFDSFGGQKLEDKVQQLNYSRKDD